MNILINNPHHLNPDPSIPFLDQALSPNKIEPLFKHHLSQYLEDFNLTSIKLIRHKPGKRCLIQYGFKNNQDQLFLIGKIRAKGTDVKSYQLQETLWNRGFRPNSIDNISVPQPLGIIPELQMWVQRKISGTIATHWLTTPQAVPLVKKIAQAAYKLHQTNIVPHRRHTLTDELEILHQKLPLVAQHYPHWQTRIEKLLEKCDRSYAILPSVEQKGIHRDFYSDQIIVNGERLFIIDFDLYCLGDPELDIGNFLGHITEYSLRILGDHNALKNLEIAMIEQFIELTHEKNRVAIAIYHLLTLVRHIYLSTQFPDRRFLTENLIDLCEQRLQKFNTWTSKKM